VKLICIPPPSAV